MKKLMLLLVVLMSLVFVSCSDDGDGGNDDPKTCTPVCDAWETCNTTTGTCELTAGKCETNANCTDTAKPNCNTATHVCEAAAVTCTPACDSWETCNNGTCELTAGKCETNTDCTGGKVCNTTTHVCETEAVECTPACDAWETCNNGTCELAAGKCEANTDCEATETCNTTTHVCENSNPGECTGLSIEANTITYDAENYIYIAYIGDAELILYFDEETPAGNYSLTSSGVNDNYATCMQCITVDKYVGDTYDSTYFQSEGSIIITSGDAYTETSVGTIVATKLIEVIIDDETLVSTPVANGRCYEIQTATWNTAAGK